MTLLHENMRKCLLEFDVNKDIFSYTGKNHENLVSRTLSKLKFCSSKDIGKKIIRQGKDQEKMS